jgi:pimeloyl-ACP methyl ester carboxylesterase
MRPVVHAVPVAALLLAAALLPLAASGRGPAGASAATAASTAPAAPVGAAPVGAAPAGNVPAVPGRASAPAHAARPARPWERLAPCHLEGIKEELRCGTYQVWEDREARRGRRIALNVVVLPALGPRPADDAIVYFAGGPGSAATREGRFLAEDKALRRRRDVLLVDQRGTGKSNPLDCDFYGPHSHAKGGDPKLLAGDLFPPAAVRQCRDRLSRTADLRLYTTALGMDDVDEVRAWLGYPQVNLVGISYGTQAAQVYLRRHSGVVRSVMLEGVAPVDELIPLHHAYAGKRAIDLLFAECAADAACHAAFPRLAQELQAVMERIDRGVKVRLPDARTGGTVEVVPSRGLIAEGLRFLGYGNGARKLPLVVHQAFAGDMAQLVTVAIDRRSELDRILSMGMNFSVTCAEDLPFIDAATAARATAGTLLGDYRIREQKRVCADWPRGSIPADAHQLVHSTVPVLLLSGERDPVTPPEFGERVARELPNSLHVVVPHSGHGSDEPCVEGIVRRFVERASVRGLVVSCVAKTPPPRFVVKAPVEVRVEARLLDSYAGSYTFPGFVITYARRGNHLVASSPGSADLDLFPDAPDHFFARSEDLEMRVVRGAGGAVAELVVKEGGAEYHGKRTGQTH